MDGIETTGQQRPATRRALRQERQRQRRLAMRHRWFAGAIAALLSGAMVVVGVPALAATGDEGDGTSSGSETSTPTPGTDGTGTGADGSDTGTDGAGTGDGAEGGDGTGTDAGKDGTEDKSAETFGTLGGDDAQIQLMLTPTSTSTVVRINKAVLRSGGGYSTSYLEGARFELQQGGSSGPNGTRWPGTVPCEIAAGDTSCDISVEGTNQGGTNRNQQPWVVELTPAPGTPAAETFAVDIATGSATGTLTDSNYPGRTAQLQSGNITQVPQTPGSGALSSIGKTTNALVNDVIVPTCSAGLNIGLVLDMSGSIDSDERVPYAKGIHDMVDILASVGGVNISTVTFNTDGQYRSAYSGPATTALADSLRTLLTTNNQYANATNWDDALTVMRANATNLDVVLMITDGAPTASRAGTVDSVRVFHVENAVLSANAIKDAGIPVWAVGVALPGGSVPNLQAISGTEANQDYFISQDFNSLGTLLGGLARGLTCQVPITITKQILDAQGNNPTADNGWTVSAAASAVTPGTGTLTPSSTTQVTGSGSNPTGQANWTLAFTDPNATGTVTVGENLATNPPRAGYVFAGGTCTITHKGGTSSTVTLTSTSQALTGIVPTDSISCVIQNRPNSAKLTLVKNVDNKGVGTHGATEWTLTAAGASGWNGTTTGTAATASTAKQTVLSGAQLTLGESGPSGYTAGSWTCDSGVTVGAGNTITLSSGADVRCQITNTVQTVTVTLVKKWTNAIQGDTATLAIGATTSTSTADGSPTFVDTAHQITVTTVPGATLDLSEVLGAGNKGTYGSTLSCTAGSYPANGNGGYTLTVPGSNTTCTFDNTASTVTVSLTKAWSNAIAGDTAGLFIKTPAGTQLQTGTATAPTGQTINATVRVGDSVVLSEVLGAGNAGAYGQTWTCTNGVTAPASNALATGTITVPAGGFSCTVTNTAKTATVTVNKQWTSGFQNDTAQITANGASGTSTLNSPSGTELDTDVVTTTVRVGDPVSIAEVLGTPSGGHYTSAWSCTGAVGSGSGTSIAIPSMPNANVVCTFTNTGVAPQLSVEKSDGTVTQLADGTWQIDYAIIVSNTSAFATSYTLTDTPDLGAGWTVVSGTWQGTAPVANRPIAAGSPAAPTTHSYVYRIIASLDPEVGQPSLTCDSTDGGAFFNTAAIAFPGGSDSDSGCAEPASPAVEKTARAATQNADGTWTLTYDVVVSNTSGIQLAYDLSDTAAALPSGVDLAPGYAWSATGPVYANEPLTDPATRDAGWAGSGHLAGGLISNGATHAYTATVRVVVAADAADDEVADCQATPAEGGGVWNTATVTNGVGGDEDGDCSEIDRPGVDIDKTVTSTIQNPDGTWTIAYDVVVTNRSSQLVAVYSLTDELLFGGDIAVDSATWTGPTSGTFSGTSATFATNRTLAKGASETYTVTANATIDVDAWEEGTVLCDESPNPDDGGFLNTATVTAAGESTTAHDCSEPALPTVAKTGVSAVQDDTDPDQWVVTYDITVSPSGFATYYTLNDIPGFASGIALAAGTAQRTDIPGQPSIPITSGGAFPAAAVALGADETHVWRVSWGATITGTPPVTAPGCTGEPGKGFYNAVELLQNGEVVDDGDACIPVKDRVYPVPAKTVTQTVQNADGTWTITYDVTVTLAGKDDGNPDELSAKYSLSDALSFGGGIVVTSATWSGESSGTFTGTTAQLAMAKTIEAGTTHTYTVTANATVPLSAYPDATACNPDGTTAGGFLNTATLTVTGTTPTTVHDCSEPKLPTIEKSGATVTQVPGHPEQWLVMYTITVSPSGYATTYQLQDIPGFASGVTLGAGSAVRTAPATPPITVDPITSGGAFPATPVALGANETQAWTVSWLATVDGSTPVTAPECGQAPTSGKGFYNLAELTSNGTVIDEDDACMDIPEPVGPAVDKTVTSTTQNADGTWTIVYSITATQPAAGPGNPDGYSGQYDLDDALEFGGDIDVQSASWTGPTGSGSFALPAGTATLATDRVILPGVTDTYTVTVVADVTAEAIEGGTTVCEPGEDPDAGGFLNTARLTSLGGDDEADACSEPVFPEIEKTGGTTVDNGDGTFDLEYTVVVSYPATTQDPEPTASYTLTDAPALPTGVSLVGAWNAAAVGADTPAPTAATWNGSGTWTIVGPTALTPTANGDGTHTYTVTATVEVTEAPAGPPQECEDTDESGILILNVGTVTSGAYEADDDGCQVVHWDDVKIEKTSELPEGQTSVEPGDSFDYVLTVTNLGTRDAQDVVVTDTLDARLQVTAVTLPAGWVNDNAPALVGPGNALSVSTPSLGFGASVDIVVTVEFLAPVVPPVTDITGGTAPDAAEPMEVLENEACVAAEGDRVPENDCDDEDIPTRDITAVVYTYCVADAAYLGWQVKKSSLLEGDDIGFTWSADGRTPTTVPYSVDLTHPGGDSSWTDELLWPGVHLTPSGVSIDYPGWRPLQATDYAPGGGFYIPGTTTVMDPAQEAEMVFNGLILDPTELDYAWRGATTVEFSVNPELSVEVEYPAANPKCAVERHADVQIEKTASLDRTYPGTPFTYTLEVQNVSEVAAADGVVVTDAIPAEIKVTDITWPGKGDATAFPNWESCTVTGQDGAGYGGTLECVLFGPLQPAGAFEDASSSAPTITLAVVTDATTQSVKVTNVAAVDACTFGDPEDCTHDEDDAVVYLWKLPFTGQELATGALAIGLLALIAGLLIIGAAVIRRRRES